jgi:hypothetical protein
MLGFQGGGGASSNRLAQTGSGAATGSPAGEPGQDTALDLVDAFNVGVVDAFGTQMTAQ